MGDSFSTTHKQPCNSEKSLSFDQTTPDIIAAISEIKKLKPTLNKVILLGLCDAASAILIALPELKQITEQELKLEIPCLVLINPWVYQDKTIAKTYLKYYYFKRLQESDFWLKLFKLKINIAYSLKAVIQRYKIAFYSRSEQSESDFINKMLIGLLDYNGKILTLLSEEDLTAKEFQLLVKENQIWGDILDHMKHKQVLLPNADHTFSSEENRNKVIKGILDWVI
jgi:exosortase A-associated hydrolase 1